MFHIHLRRLASVFAVMITAALMIAAPARAEDRDAAVGDLSYHQSTIRLTDADAGKRRNIKLGLGKSVLIEMPRAARDVMVSNPRTVDAIVQSQNRIFIVARRFGESNAFIFDDTGEQFATLEIFVERETAGLENLLRRLVPGSNIRVEMLNGTAILTGTVRTPVDANRASALAKQFVTVEFDAKSEENVQGVEVKAGQKEATELVINMLTVEGEEQVMLKVTVAEVQRSLLKQLGVNLGASINAGNFATTLLTENALPLTAAAGLGNLPIPGVGTQGTAAGDPVTCLSAGQLCNFNPGPTDGTFGNSGLSGGWTNGDTRVTHAIRALERAGLVRTLAEPNLTAISGESAKFLAGGEFPIPVADGQGGISVTYKEFGVAVAFTPTVMSEGRISLKIETEVSELSNVGAVVVTGFSIPALRKRQAKSTVELPSGGSLALAGLISDDVRQNIDGLPGLKDLPVLGTLFRSRDFIKQESELVVIVTPYIVKATTRQELAKPLDGLGEATDLKANFLGHLNRIYGSPQSAPAGDLKGDYGFIVE
ncbi:MAG: type II and III secretion system protein family protein [Hyphomicrobium sp.]|nr:type II and III secretion system protein family protein [Hyphomicrobium sp.]